MKIFLFLGFFFPTILWAAGISYTVNFEGSLDSSTLRAVKGASELVALRKKSPPSINALRFRAQSDIPTLVKVLHAQGYFEAQVDVSFQEIPSGTLVLVSIQSGPQYQIGTVSLTGAPCRITPHNIGLDRGNPALTQAIVDGELKALQLLSDCGYPLAMTKSREIIADGEAKVVTIELHFDAGPFARFGPTTIHGNTKVKRQFIEDEIAWNEGDPYNSTLVDCTQKELMDSCLFSSVYIIHDTALDDDGQLPMTIDVRETKHRSVSVGASYQTTFGPGATFGWENRNLDGMGRRISLQADIAQRVHSGVATYLIPNFYLKDQDFIVGAQAAHESITAYKSQSYHLLSRITRQVDCNFYFSSGLKAEYLRVYSSVDNGNFFLVEAPAHLRWSNVSDFLCPQKGMTVEYRATPTVSIKSTTKWYYSQMVNFCSYLPFGTQNQIILAQKLTVGSILSPGRKAVPVPRRFLGGSEDNLRGYKYLTVSPLDSSDKPIGGRSALYYTIEPRIRINESVGIVPFFDIGNVYKNQFPTFGGKWRKSVGIGLRYYSFLGPLRLDFAFPLDRRSGIDPTWWVYVSVGETF
ncbi:MAG: Translocation and assembly module TamA [Chlamydiae bacterium]|nr:Translocation and assembly module TamA [Chlamydiota bacterium]